MRTFQALLDLPSAVLLPLYYLTEYALYTPLIHVDREDILRRASTRLRMAIAISDDSSIANRRNGAANFPAPIALYLHPIDKERHSV